MTKTLDAIGRASSKSLLARILEAPDLATQVQALAPPALAKLIDRIGLEDAGELVAFATTEQLAGVFDDDLWRSDRPGEDAHFDADRFSVWLEVMLEAGDAFVAEKLTSLPEDLVTLAFHTQILVVPQDALTAELDAQDDDAQATEKALASCLSEELDAYVVIARRPEGWDNVLTAILALDRDHHAYVARLLERCSAMSAEVIDDNGSLFDVLTSEEMLEGDVAGEREERRSEAGHVAPSAAAAFLKAARRGHETPLTEHDPMTRAYLRGLARDTHRAPAKTAPRRESALAALLREEANDAHGHAAPRLAASSAKTHHAETRDHDEPLLARAMRILAVDDPETHAARSEEIAYLANVLAAGCTVRGRRFRPAEAVRGAIATTNLGLEISMQPTRIESANVLDDAVLALRRYPADGLFRQAWKALAISISTPASRLAAHARHHLNDAGLNDPTFEECVRALIDECPSLAGPLARAVHAERIESERNAVQFITTKRDMVEAISFLAAAAARFANAR